MNWQLFVILAILAAVWVAARTAVVIGIMKIAKEDKHKISNQEAYILRSQADIKKHKILRAVMLMLGITMGNVRSTILATMK